MSSRIYAKAAIQISKPIEVVFDSIVDPQKMSNYFIESGTGRLDGNKEIIWKLPEFQDTFLIKVTHIQKHDYISFDWNSINVQIFLEKITPNQTVVRIKEGPFNHDSDSITMSIGQTEGWSNFLASLKAYIEYGINLRKGAFDFMHS